GGQDRRLVLGGWGFHRIEDTTESPALPPAGGRGQGIPATVQVPPSLSLARRPWPVRRRTGPGAGRGPTDLTRPTAGRRAGGSGAGGSGPRRPGPAQASGRIGP